MQFISVLRKINQYRFRPRLLPTVTALMLLPILISLGQWQANKAERKQKLQQAYLQRAALPPLLLDKHTLQPEDRYRKVLVRGRYEPRYQILLDNQIDDGRIGYQVITPLHIENSDIRVLVDRGWVPASAYRSILPEAEPPSGLVEISGIADLPSGRYLELETQPQGAGWQRVWQNLDMTRYRNLVPFPLQALAIRLDPASDSGYVLHRPTPDLHIETNKGYAFQWYAMAVLLCVYYFITQFRKTQPQGDYHAS